MHSGDSTGENNVYLGKLVDLNTQIKVATVVVESSSLPQLQLLYRQRDPVFATNDSE